MRWLYAALLPAVLPNAVRPAQAQTTVELVIVATTDVHGHVNAWDYVNDRPAPWGLVRAATAIDSIRHQHPGRVIVVDAGDLIQGSPFATYFARTPTTPHPIVDAMNAIGYDALVPGNHEFDFGLDLLSAVVQGAAFPVVAYNAYRLPRDTFAFQPIVVLTRAGVRVGVTGLTTPGSMIWDRDMLKGRLRISPVIPDAVAAMDDLDAARSDLRVVLIHSGMDGVSSYDTTGTGPENVAARLATLPVRPHLVVVGHSHREMVDSVINGVHFIQPQAWARSLSVATVRLRRRNSGGYRVVSIRGSRIPLDGVEPKATLVRRFFRWHNDVRNWVGTPLAMAKGDFSERLSRAEDTPIIDYINEVQRSAAHTDLSATAAFNPDGGFPSGPVRLRDVAGIYPYENTLKAVQIDGATLRRYLEKAAEYFNTYEPGKPIINDAVSGFNFDIVSGIEYVIDLSQPVGSRIRQISRDGRLVKDTDMFSLALNSYRQAGGGGYSMVSGLPVVYDKGENVRDLIAAWLRSDSVIDSREYRRINWRIVPREAALEVRAAFSGRRGSGAITVVRLLATSDLHGILSPFVASWSGNRPIGGAPALKALMDSLSLDCECADIRVATGDQLLGSDVSDLFRGQSTVQALNAMGLDVAVPGDGDLAWGADTLRNRVAESSYRWLAADARYGARAVAPDWLNAGWTIIDKPGARVAVIGLSDRAHDPSNLLDFELPTTAVERAVKAVARYQPDAVVLLAHSGIDCDTEGCSGPLVDLANALEPGQVDVIVGGESHTQFTGTLNGIPVVVPGSYGAYLGVVDLVQTGPGRLKARVAIDTVWADGVTPDSTVSAIVAAFTDRARATVERKVATLKFSLPAGRGETDLSRLVADAYRNTTRTQIALVPNEMIRDGLKQGQVRYGHVYRVHPVPETLDTLTVTGKMLKALFEEAVLTGDPAVTVSGIRVRYDLRKKPGDRIRRIETMDGEKIKKNRNYTLTTPHSVALGKHGFARLREVSSMATDMTDLDALVTYLGRLPQPVEAPADVRFVKRQ